MGSYRGFTAAEERFYTAMIEREERKRLNWFLKQGGDELLKELQRDADEQDKKLKELEEAQKKKMERMLREKRAENGKDEERAVVLAAAMRPVPQHVRNLIRSDREFGGGRKNYLQARKRLAPKEKYYFAESKNWEYGWNAEELIPGEQSGEYGRTAVIHQSFYRRAGVLAYNPLHRSPVNMESPVIIPWT